VGIRNLGPHLRNSAILRTTKSIAEVRTKKSCGTAIADPQNLTSAIPQLSGVSCQFHYFLASPFFSAQNGFKINQKYFLDCLFLWKTKTCLKGTVPRDFLPPIFFHELTGFHGHKLPKIAEVKLSSCGLQKKKLGLQNCGVAVAGQHFFQKLRNCDCGSVSFKLRDCN
jgi:hypothetical protein